MNANPFPNPSLPPNPKGKKIKMMVWSKVYDTEIAALEGGNDDYWSWGVIPLVVFHVGDHGKLDRSRLGGIPVGFSGGLANASNIKILQRQRGKRSYYPSVAGKCLKP